ncbi:MAG: holo-[acyl-carrier-protein] synthase [Acidobacteria bacterium]|nr:holo-[acyl-carrier-protein] synthase [Acidobacteriota bacterium]
MIPGVDIVSAERIKTALNKFGEAFARHILTSEELALYRERKDNVLFLAGRFAAKEAVYKAAGIPGLTWQRVMVMPEEKRPVVWIDGRRRQDIRVSISHEKEFAIAFAIAESG